MSTEVSLLSRDFFFVDRPRNAQSHFREVVACVTGTVSIAVAPLFRRNSWIHFVPNKLTGWNGAVQKGERAAPLLGTRPPDGVLELAEVYSAHGRGQLAFLTWYI